MTLAPSPRDLKPLDAWWRAANYLSVGQIYLQANPLLTEPLALAHIKPRLLGHWGTTPGLTLVCAHLNRLIREEALDVLLVVGPGHGGPGVVAASYLDGSYSERFPAVERNASGLLRLFRQFSWPGGIPSHAGATTPGSIHEGGELGYSLAHAYGAAFDNPGLIVACVVGDGEAETGPLATSWHSNKFINPAVDGAVLPILHLNGYKIANPTLLARIPRDELTTLLQGLGHTPHFVEGDDPEQVHAQFAQVLDAVLRQIRHFQALAREPEPGAPPPERPRWPMIVLRTPKGWTGPKEVDGLPVEGTWRAHQVPLSGFEAAEQAAQAAQAAQEGATHDLPSPPQPADPTAPLRHLAQLEAWLRSYRPNELFDAAGHLQPELAALAPTGPRRLGANPHAEGGGLLQALQLPVLAAHALSLAAPGAIQAEATRVLGGWLRELVQLNAASANFRLFGPDETASNRLGAVLDVTAKAWMLACRDTDEHLAPAGRVMEVLSEHLCEGWLEGYLLTGRHGLLSSYEAFMPIVGSMVAQHAKWLKTSRRMPWRAPLASLNILLTSHVWRQDHNGLSHQDPGFLDTVAQQSAEVARIWLPPDANCLLAVAEHCLRSRDHINLIVAGKQPEWQWLGPDDALRHCAAGASIWHWAGNESGPDEPPDVVLACAGDVPTLETLAAAQLLRQWAPSLRVRVVNVVDLMALQSPAAHPHGLSEHDFDALFTRSQPVVFAFHGFPALVHALTYRRHNHANVHVHGFRGEGSTTTPFDMVVLNRLDRFHLALDALARVPRLAEFLPAFQTYCEAMLQSHGQHIAETGDDLPELRHWRWLP